MMAGTLTEKLTKTAECMKLYQREHAILDVTELICEVMAEQRVTRGELARRLARSQTYVTRMLDGRANLSVERISDVFTALGRGVYFQQGPLRATVRVGKANSHQHTPTEALPTIPRRLCADTEQPCPLLVDRVAAAKMLSVSERTLWSMTKPRGPIPALRLLTSNSTRARGVIRYSVLPLVDFVSRASDPAPDGRYGTQGEPVS